VAEPNIQQVCHRTSGKSSHCGCGLLELALWRCGVSARCYDEGKLQVVEEGLVKATNSHIPIEEGS
jgi:hypothetical protein